MLKKFLLFLYNTSENIVSKKDVNFRRSLLVRAFRRRLNNYVISHYKTNYVEIDGRKMFLDENDSLRLSFKKYGLHEMKIAKKMIKKGDIVVDIGANIGFWTLVFAELVGKSGHVFAFEPGPENFRILQKNVEINNLQNVTLSSKAISDKPSKTKLFLSYESNDHRIYDPKDNREAVEIETITLDEYFKNFDQKINFIKTNIQGSDHAALIGMHEILQKSPSIKLVMEFYPELLEGMNSSAEKFITTLTEEGFTVYNFLDNNNLEIPINKQDMILKYSPESGNSTMLFCVRE